jgi:uncharacterized membrane protein YfhO
MLKVSLLKLAQHILKITTKDPAVDRDIMVCLPLLVVGLNCFISDEEGLYYYRSNSRV